MYDNIPWEWSDDEMAKREAFQRWVRLLEAALCAVNLLAHPSAAVLAGGIYYPKRTGCEFVDLFVSWETREHCLGPEAHLFFHAYLA